MGRIEEFLLIIGVGLLFFGPNKMVDFAKGLGTALREFKKAANGESPAADTAPKPSNPAALPSETKVADSTGQSTAS